MNTHVMTGNSKIKDVKFVNDEQDVEKLNERFKERTVGLEFTPKSYFIDTIPNKRGKFSVKRYVACDSSYPQFNKAKIAEVCNLNDMKQEQAVQAREMRARLRKKIG